MKPSNIPTRVLITAKDATILNHFQEMGLPKAGSSLKSRKLLKLLSQQATPITSSIETFFGRQKSGKKTARSKKHSISIHI
jgi:hypothetical protein